MRVPDPTVQPTLPLAQGETGAADARVGAATVPVLVPLPLDEPFDYAVPEALSLAPGDLSRCRSGRAR